MKNIHIFCAFSFLLIVPGIYFLFEHSLLTLGGEKFHGRITGFEYKSLGDSTHAQNRGTKYPVVEFTDSYDQKRVLSTASMEFFFKAYNENDVVSVYYHEGTDRLIINDFYSLWSQPLFLIILGGLICNFGRKLKRI